MKTLCIAIVALLTQAVQLQAGIISYSSRVAFDAAVPSQQTITFEGLGAIGSFTTYGTTLSTGGVTFTSNTTDITALSVRDPGYAGSFYTLGTGQALVDVDGKSSITLQPGTKAVGFDFATNLTGRLTIVNSAGDIVNSNFFTGFGGAGPQSKQFIGFTSDTVITSLSYSPVGGGTSTIIIDNFTTNQQAVASVPEPSAMAVFGLGAVCFAFMGRKRRPSALPA